MATIFNIGIPKVSAAGSFTRLCKISKSYNAIQVAFIKRAAYVEPRRKPPPFPYWRKAYTLYHQMFDPMEHRFDENTKILAVEGLPGIGKTKLCEKLADELEMLYMPPPAHEDMYVLKDRYDLRKYDEQYGSLIRSFDTERFLQNPHDERVAYYQLQFLMLRYEQYINAMLHLLSTGQGVILNRTYYSDIVFLEAMFKAGYFNKDVVKYYMFMRDIAVENLLKPHLVIYLDVPVELVQKKIKERNRPHEANSKVLTTTYLSNLEEAYKEKYLKPMADHSYVLAYDWSKEGNPMQVLEDIEEVDFKYEKNKLSDWSFISTSDVRDMRFFCDNKEKLYRGMERYPIEDVPEGLYITEDDAIRYREIHENPSNRIYADGYHPDHDKNLLFKSWGRLFPSIRMTNRDFLNREKYMS